MKRQWNAPVMEELEIKGTEFYTAPSSKMDAWVYDDATGEVVIIIGYKSGAAAE